MYSDPIDPSMNPKILRISKCSGPCSTLAIVIYVYYCVYGCGIGSFTRSMTFVTWIPNSC